MTSEITGPVLPQPTLGIDIDGCIDECPDFFRILTHCWPGKVIVVTYRRDRGRAEDVLRKYAIRFDELILVSTFEAKAEVVREKDIRTYFDDQPEMLKNVSATTNVMLVRNEGNFDFADRRWMFSDHTGKKV
jgi:hypothetical protein